MQITRAADYAVRVMVHLASLPPGTRVQKRTLVELSEAPKSFLSKVLQRMVAQGLIRSWRGGGGGFELARPANQVSVLNVVEAIDGPIHLNLCVPGASGCERSLACAVHPVWVEARTALVRVLNRATMAKLAKRRKITHDPIATELQNLP
ncbi:MAG TPA: Rrf2 family transcriptional regulator [Candidatus Eisenbacteria bacterium]|nr:Rrf2 family transcriptional regulator [Candidatus Eisenbacteria bacterium]